MIKELRDLAEDGRYFIDTALNLVGGEFIITPESGTTVYIIGAIIQNNGAFRTNTSIAVQEGATSAGEDIKERARVPVDGHRKFRTPFFRVVGDGTRRIRVGVTDTNFTIWGYRKPSKNL